MITYVDSSALVRRYARQRGSLAFRRFLLTATVVATVATTRVEIVSALRRLEREGRIGRRGIRRTLRAVDEDWPVMWKVPVNDLLIERAEHCLAAQNLRAADAIQLAAAMLFANLLGEPVTFAVFDVRLRTAARAAGFSLWPVSLARYR